MPKEIKKHQTILEAIEKVDIISELLEKHNGHYEHELDLEVIAYGRNYNGKKVGPYVQLFEFDAGEEVIREGDWGGNTFYVSVEGQLHVYVRDRETEENRKVGELHPGASFGEMSILAGVPRNATIVVPAGSKAKVSGSPKARAPSAAQAPEVRADARRQLPQARSGPHAH